MAGAIFVFRARRFRSGPYGRQMSVEGVSELAGRPGWTVAGDVATYQPTEDGPSALVRLLQVRGHTYRQWHVVIRDGNGRARRTFWVVTLAEAVRTAERSVS